MKLSLIVKDPDPTEGFVSQVIPGSRSIEIYNTEPEKFLDLFRFTAPRAFICHTIQIQIAEQVAWSIGSCQELNVDWDHWQDPVMSLLTG